MTGAAVINTTVVTGAVRYFVVSRKKALISLKEEAVETIPIGGFLRLYLINYLVPIFAIDKN